MNVYSAISIATTVLTFVAFVGIVAWAYGRGRKAAFNEAANAPFALPDDAGDAGANDTCGEPRS